MGKVFPVNTMVLVKKGYTALAVELDTRSEEQITIDEKNDKCRREAMHYLMALASTVMYQVTDNSSMPQSLTNDSRITRGSAFRRK
jgi:hypothetical protein